MSSPRAPSSSPRALLEPPPRPALELPSSPEFQRFLAQSVKLEPSCVCRASSPSAASQSSAKTSTAPRRRSTMRLCGTAAVARCAERRRRAPISSTRGRGGPGQAQHHSIRERTPQVFFSCLSSCILRWPDGSRRACSLVYVQLRDPWLSPTSVLDCSLIGLWLLRELVFSESALRELSQSSLSGCPGCSRRVLWLAKRSLRVLRPL